LTLDFAVGGWTAVDRHCACASLQVTDLYPIFTVINLKCNPARRQKGQVFVL
jgi:hypothetical protein